MALPLIIVFVVLLAYPLGMAVWISFTNKRFGYGGEFIGLQNYLSLIRNPFFRLALRNSILYAGIAVGAKCSLGLGMALILNQTFKGRNLFRGFLFIPFVIPVISTALTWMWMYDPRLGIINNILRRIGIISSPIAWLTCLQFALPSIIIYNIWQGFPFHGIMLLAGLQTIPKEQYEVAEIDGASVIAKFLHITIPYLRFPLLVVLVLSTIWTFNEFQRVYILTQGGPGKATNTIATLTYEVAFTEYQLGRGEAVSLIAAPFLGVLIFFIYRTFRENI